MAQRSKLGHLLSWARSMFIFDPLILKAEDTGAPIVGFMLECLRALEKDIAHAGAKLIFRHGPPEREMEALLRETGATSLYYNRDYEPQARKLHVAQRRSGAPTRVGGILRPAILPNNPSGLSWMVARPLMTSAVT